jgi:hypothetical protein
MTRPRRNKFPADRDFDDFRADDSDATNATIAAASTTSACAVALVTSALASLLLC